VSKTKAPPGLELPPGFLTETFAATKKTISQKQGKRRREIYNPDDPLFETDREVSLPSSIASSIAGDSEDDEQMPDETPKQRRQRRRRQASPFGEQSILQAQLAAQASIGANTAIVTTVEILTDEVKSLKKMITSLMTTVTNLQTQNGDLKQGQNRMEQQIQKIGRQSREPPKPNNNGEKAPPTQPNTNRRQQNQNPPPNNPDPNHPNPQATQQSQGNSWAKVARKGNENRENAQAPPKRFERTIIVHRSSDTTNAEINLHYMRDTINNILRFNKAPTTLTIAGIQWNQRGNLTLTTLGSFTEDELAPHIITIRQQVEKFDKEVSAVGKQETWTKVIVHGVDTEHFVDSEEGMNKLRYELETFNQGLALASAPRYLTRPENRVEKAHSSCVIAMKDKSHLKGILKYGLSIFGRQCRTAEYFAARPSDQCTRCQGFGHHYRRCTREPACGICADPHHETRMHTCIACTSRLGCDHKPAKCANCAGNPRANDRTCETFVATKNPKSPEGDGVTDSAMQEEL
jgi:hypothetical protein